MKCLDFEAEYVGETTQQIDARIYQHKIAKDGQHELTKSHIIEHTQRLRHKIDWQNYSVLARASNELLFKNQGDIINKKKRIPVMNNNETSVLLNLF